MLQFCQFSNSAHPDSDYICLMKYLLAFALCLSLSVATNAQVMGGIGAQLILDTAGGTTMPRIMTLVPHTPADSNLHATDFIMSIDGVSCKDKTIEEVVSMIRGDTGTKLKIVVADTKEGKRPRHYELTRRALPGVAPLDPMAAFNAWCDNEVQQLKAKRAVIIKTYNATCGDRFFNFEAEARTYHVLVMTMEDKDGGTAFHATARVFDNDNEATATSLAPMDPHDQGKTIIARCGGDVTFAKACIGAVNVQMHDDVSKCHGLYVVVYR